jgi:ribosomal protein L18
MAKSYTLYISFENNKTIVQVIDNDTNQVVAVFSGTDRDRVLTDAENYINRKRNEKANSK